MPNNDAQSPNELVGERVRIFRRGRKWHANFQIDGRQVRITLHTTSHKQARLQAQRMDRDLSLGEHRSETKPATLAECIEAFMTNHRVSGRKPRTLAKYQNHCNLFAKFAASRNVTKISEIGLRFADAYRQARVDEGSSAVTVHDDLVTLRSLVSFALTRKMVSADPLEGFKNPEPRPTTQPCWTRAEVAKILVTCGVEERAALTILADTGMRFEELAHLEWVDVDFGKREVMVRPKGDWTPKSDDVRRVPMTPGLFLLLQTLPRKNNWVVPRPPSRYYDGWDRRWSEKRLLNALKRTLKKLGLEGHLHTFKHAFISHALAQGMPIPVLKALVGHVSDETLALYTHVHREVAQDYMKKVFGTDAETGTESSESAAG